MFRVNLFLDKPHHNECHGAEREMGDDMFFCSDIDRPGLECTLHDMELFFDFHQIPVGLNDFLV